jgi:hypothetical protein
MHKKLYRKERSHSVHNNLHAHVYMHISLYVEEQKSNGRIGSYTNLRRTSGTIYINYIFIIYYSSPCYNNE